MSLEAVMSAAWDFAPDPVVVAAETNEEPAVASPPCRMGWSVTPFSQRWLVVGIALVFLFWIWTTDRKSPPAPAETV